MLAAKQLLFAKIIRENLSNCLSTNVYTLEVIILSPLYIQYKGSTIRHQVVKEKVQPGFNVCTQILNSACNYTCTDVKNCLEYRV